MDTEYAQNVLNNLYRDYPDAHCELNHRSPFELLVATVLSAQTTDKKVNQVTERLFKKYKSPYDFVKLTQEELQDEIREIGLYKNKAKNIISMCQSLIKDYNGEVPKDKDELMKLAGVGVKTANVVISNAFNIPAMAVDTHVFRVSNRIGIADAKTVEETEKQLMHNIPRDQWVKAHHTLIFHGRRTCAARKPKCDICSVKSLCRYYNENINNK